MFRHSDHMSIFGDTYHGVPNPQVLHDHPYPTRYHGPNYAYPYFGKPYRENPNAVPPFMGFGAATVGGEPLKKVAVEYRLEPLTTGSSEFLFAQLSWPHREIVFPAPTWRAALEIVRGNILGSIRFYDSRKPVRIYDARGNVIFENVSTVPSRPLNGGLGACGACSAPKAGGADGLSGLDSLTASPTGSIVIDALVGGIIGGLMAKSSNDRLVWAGGGAVAALVAGAVGLVGIVAAGAYVRRS